MIDNYPDKSRQRGLTVIELMITLAVFTVLAAMALPSFERTLERRRLVGAADNIFAYLQYARSESIKQNEDVTVHYDDSDDWCLGLDDNLDDICNCKTNPDQCTVNGLEKTLQGSDYRDITMDADGFDGNYFEFDPRLGGLVESDDDGDFEITTSHNENKCIELNAVGRIKITDGACI